MNKKFIATNKLEESLINARDNKILLPEFMKLFLESDLIVPSAAEAQDDGSIVPLFFNKDGNSMLSIFTSVPLLNLYEDNIKHHLTRKGKEILMQMPPNKGLVINPGYAVGFDISPTGITNIINDFLGN